MRIFRYFAVALLFICSGDLPAFAQNPPGTLPSAPPPQPRPQHHDSFSVDEIVGAGHKFFGTVSRGLATVIEKATSQWGQPNGYILGQEAGGAFVAGLRYGEGTLYTRNAGDLKVYWQGPPSVSTSAAKARGR